MVRSVVTCSSSGVERARPMFEVMGRTITHVGTHGDGQKVKLVNQILVVITMWVQLWFEIWWLSLLVFVLAGLASEWAWRRGGPSYEHQRSDLMDEVLYEQRTGRRSGQAG